MTTIVEFDTKYYFTDFEDVGIFHGEIFADSFETLLSEEVWVQLIL